MNIFNQIYIFTNWFNWLHPVNVNHEKVHTGIGGVVIWEGVIIRNNMVSHLLL